MALEGLHLAGRLDGCSLPLAQSSPAAALPLLYCAQ